MTGEISIEDRARAMMVIIQRDRNRVRHLRGVVRGSFERSFLNIDPAEYDDTDHAVLARLVWHYRNNFPRGLRPTVNPADPIVRGIGGEVDAFLRTQVQAHG